MTLKYVYQRLGQLMEMTATGFGAQHQEFLDALARFRADVAAAAQDLTAETVRLVGVPGDTTVHTVDAYRDKSGDVFMRDSGGRLEKAVAHKQPDGSTHYEPAPRG
jgi:hypothetical protein